MSVPRVRVAPLRFAFSWGAVALLTVAALLAYGNSLSVPFNFDDADSIPDNPSIRQLWPLGPVLDAERGRPLANLSFALNYAFNGTHVVGYHVVNLALHLATALTLFAVLRRIFAQSVLTSPDRSSQRHHDATSIALAIAVVWLVHPLHPASVTYLSQRTEVLMAFFYLQTLLGFLIAVNPATSERKRAVALLGSCLACALGMAAKETMVTAPLVVLLFDRVFVSDSFRTLWRARRGYYAGLGATWIFLLFLLRGLHARSVGFEVGVSPFQYALTEAEAVLTYLRLVVWPHPLVFDYGAEMSALGLRSLSYVAGLAAVVTLVVVAFARWPRASFAGAVFFLLLAPTSSVVPVALQPIAENRPYLAAAAVFTLGFLAIHRWIRRALWPVAAVIALGFAALTSARNARLQDLVGTWQETTLLRPANARAWENYGAALAQQGRFDDALRPLMHAFELNPKSPGGYRILGDVYFNLKRYDDAIAAYQQALALKPGQAGASSNLGRLLLARGEDRAGLELLEASLRLEPRQPTLHRHAANVWLKLNEPGRAAEHLERLQGTPEDDAAAHFVLGNQWFARNQTAAALAQFERATQLDPNSAPYHFALSTALLVAGRPAEAVTAARRALQLQPDFPDATHNIAVAQYKLGNKPAARALLTELLAKHPDHAGARSSLTVIDGENQKN